MKLQTLQDQELIVVVRFGAFAHWPSWVLTCKAALEMLSGWQAAKGGQLNHKLMWAVCAAAADALPLQSSATQ